MCASPRLSFLRIRRPAIFRDHGGNAGTGVIGTYSLEATAAFRPPFQTLTWLDPARSPIACSSRLRNFAIAKGLEQAPDFAVENAWFRLCSHDDNPEVAEHWKKWRRLLPDPAMAPSLPASEVVNAGEAAGFLDWATWMRDRYRL